MFTTSKQKIAQLEKQLEKAHRIINAKESEISTLKVQNASYERLVERLQKENEAENTIIAGLERETIKLRASLGYIDHYRKQNLNERDAARRECAEWKNLIETIERDGLCCVCAIGASRAECGVTCNFKYKGGIENVKPES